VPTPENDHDMTAENRQPIIGISVNLEDGQYRSRTSYADAISKAGGIPILLTCLPEMIPHYLGLCDAFVTSGGDDPDTTTFGIAPHPEATLMDPMRQTFELGLLKSLEKTTHPLLSVCLGMQLFALSHGGTLEQHLPDALETADEHWNGRIHAISGKLGNGSVHSHHKQAMASAGSLEVIARSHDGLIEAVRDPAHTFRVGVQWHPERTLEHPFGQGLFEALIRATTDGRSLENGRKNQSLRSENG
jgi:putative glutamine amidotransferase